MALDSDIAFRCVQKLCHFEFGLVHVDRGRNALADSMSKRVQERMIKIAEKVRDHTRDKVEFPFLNAEDDKSIGTLKYVLSNGRTVWEERVLKEVARHLVNEEDRMARERAKAHCKTQKED